jgi:methyl-accepting chemotaxis protein
MLNRFKLSTRILFLGVAIVLFASLVFVWIIPRLKKEMFDAKYSKTRNVVESAWGVLDHFAKLADAGTYTEAQAKALAMNTIKHMRYDKNDYFWINDMTPRMIMHPVQSSLDGADLSEKRDPNGKRPFVEMVKVCEQSGQGFVEYDWPKPGSPKPVPKISYVKLLPQWGWIVGSGIYLDDVEKEVSAIIWGIVAFILLIAVVGVSLSYLMARSIASPINNIVEGLDTAADLVSEGAGHIAGTGQELAEGASEQASAIEETSASLKEMSTKGRQATELTNEADVMMNENIQKSGNTLKALKDLMGKMTQIESDSGKIGQIIKNIDDIAFQTNLLALNAAVEAARAGEAGAGFAVVADEVRSLAIRATTAAHNTQELLDGIVNQVTVSSDSIKSVNADFEDIIESATAMGEKTDAISRAADELSNGIEQVSQAVSQMEQVTQRNAASAEESAAAAEEMDAQSQEMKRFVDILSKIVGGQADRRIRTPRARPAAGNRSASPAKLVPARVSRRIAAAPATERSRSFDSDPDGASGNKAFEDF